MYCISNTEKDLFDLHMLLQTIAVGSGDRLEVGWDKRSLTREVWSGSLVKKTHGWCAGHTSRVDSFNRRTSGTRSHITISITNRL